MKSLFSRARLYLDAASAAPVTKRAQKAFDRAQKVAWANPGAPHADGRAAREVLEDARLVIARMGSVKPPQVVFTSGATEANNLAIQGAVRARRAVDATAPIHILYLPTSHASVRETVLALASNTVIVEELTLCDGQIDLAHFRSQLRKETLLVCVDAVCGETGIMFPVRDVARVLAEAGSRAKLHVDASQLPRAASFELTRLGAHSLTLDAQKVGGVRGIGALLLGHGVTIAPLQYGGGQEEGLRSGTPAPALAASFAAALTECAKTRGAFQECAAAARSHFIKLLQTALPDAVVNTVLGKHAEQAAHILNFSFPGRDTDYAVALLDAAGISVSTRSACESDSDGSRVVLALTEDIVRANSTMRISWDPCVTTGQLMRAAKEVIRTIQFLDQHKV